MARDGTIPLPSADQVMINYVQCNNLMLRMELVGQRSISECCLGGTARGSWRTALYGAFAGPQLPLYGRWIRMVLWLVPSPSSVQINVLSVCHLAEQFKCHQMRPL